MARTSTLQRTKNRSSEVSRVKTASRSSRGQAPSPDSLVADDLPMNEPTNEHDRADTETVCEKPSDAIDVTEWCQRAIYVCEQAARGDFEPRILGCDPSSDFGRLGIAINDLLDRADGFVREAGATLEHASQNKFYRRVLLNGMVGAYHHAAQSINSATEEMAKKSQSLVDHEKRRSELADEFERNVGAVVESLADSAGNMRRLAERLAELSDGSREKSLEGASAACSAADNVALVVKDSLALTQSQQEVEQRVGLSNTVAEEAVGEAERTTGHVHDLGAATDRISQVVTLIADIARQTNLLSINAAIEAAHAGEIGRGFAVVANEVKKLADQTSDATKRVTKEIKALQVATSTTAGAINRIGGSIHRIHGLAADIAEAVDEQKSLTAAMDSRFETTRECFNLVSATIEEATAAATATSGSTGHLLSAADDMSAQSAALRVAVEQFLTHIRR